MSMKQYHYAIVTRLETDKEKETLRGAIFIQSPTLTRGTEWPEKIQPSFPVKGMFWVPAIEEQVEIEIDDANEHPVPKITRFVYSQEEDIDDIFKENYPFRRGWISLSGHYLLYDDSEEDPFVQLLHKIGTNFKWNKDGDEIKEIVRDLKETIKRDVIREITGRITETVKGDIKRIVKGEVKQEITKDFKVDGKGNIDFKAKGDLKGEGASVALKAKGEASLEGTGGTKVGAGASPTDILGSLVNLGGGGLPVARVGDQVIGIGNLGAPVVSNIVAGSPTVTSG